MFSKSDPRHVAMAASLSAAVLMLIGKGTAYLLTGSPAIFSDAAESVVHVLATAFVGFSLWYSDQPPDAGHPYGHGKIAYFAAGVEGTMILVAGVAIVISAYQALATGFVADQLGAGLALIGGTVIINLALGGWLVVTGRRHRSLILVSNGQHLLTDMWTSLGVIVGVGLVQVTGWAWVDPVVALLVTVNIVWIGIRLVRQSLSGLMERANPADTDRLRGVLDAAVLEGRVTGYHQLRHRRVGEDLWVEYHVQLPGALGLLDAHARAHVVETEVVAAFPGDQVYVTAHLEPEEHDEAHPEDHLEPRDPLLDASNG